MKITRELIEQFISEMSTLSIGQYRSVSRLTSVYIRKYAGLAEEYVNPEFAPIAEMAQAQRLAIILSTLAVNRMDLYPQVTELIKAQRASVRRVKMETSETLKRQRRRDYMRRYMAEKRAEAKAKELES